MKITGSHVVDQPVDRVWAALLDPQVLVSTIPGCSRLEETGPHAYDMTVTAGVAAIKGTYDGCCALADLHEHESLTMRLTGAGAPGTVDATVAVRFSSPGPGQTEIAYDADAVVGGMVGGVGQRMLSSVSKRMAGEFFGNVAAALEAGGAGGAPAHLPTAESLSGAHTSPPEGVPTAQSLTGGRTYTATPSPGAAGRGDFLKGVAVGAGLVTLGVVIGGLFGRRR
ncbi:carbon monoxide dehydrogenase subunit G [Nocardioides anomalus]|uniref:Carbon monoxide dehydrogenase subunit G n=1 Tax=Nocardioides anomalus TaxID=2712223 RepID=A0A6G6WFN2_9ACTN|nr:carbon monoxide dehydrogenase subunit G [Nocardioides anomalus]QIG43967.1 carbon monoxide dehydrogenase subunit G [Nocardioides anomalus]